MKKQQSRKLSGYAERVQLFSNLESGPTRAFRANLPALDLFPSKIWTQIAARRLQRLSIPQLLGCDTMGYFPLRTAVADYLNTSRGTECKPEQVMIVSGMQEALDLAGRLILNPGDQVRGRLRQRISLHGAACTRVARIGSTGSGALRRKF